MQAEYRQAISELQQARQNFDNAAPEFVDAAIYNLRAAEIKVDAITTQLKRREEGRCFSGKENLMRVQLQ